MKIKELAIETGMIALNLATIITTFLTTSGNNNPAFHSGLLSGFTMGFGVMYWAIKKQLIDTEHPNAEYAIKMWRYITVVTCLGSMLVCYLGFIGFFKNQNIFGAYYFVLTAIWANYRNNIYPNIDPVFAFLEDEDVSKKTYRLVAKVTFLTGIVFAVTTLFVSENWTILLIFAQLIFGFLTMYFYGKRYHYLKYK